MVHGGGPGQRLLVGGSEPVQDLLSHRVRVDGRGGSYASDKKTAPTWWGMKGKAWTGGDFGRVLMQYDDLAGAASNNIEARIRELAEDGIERELAFPNAVLALFHYPGLGAIVMTTPSLRRSTPAYRAS